MAQKIFQSKHPILEACMNKGSTLQLALAVHNAGGYPSLCSWTYNRHFGSMQKDLDKFVKETNSNRIHLSFELDDLPNPEVCHDIMKSYNVPTMEIIYGYTDSPRPEHEFLPNTELQLQRLLGPLREMGVTVVKRSYSPVDETTMKRHLLNGFCLKGREAAGFTGFIPTKDLFLQQKQLTPDAILIPYGGVGTAQQVKEYIDLGAEIVGVGTLLAMSAESPVKIQTKLSAILADKEKLKIRKHDFVSGNEIVERKQNMLEFQPYQGQDDANGTMGLVKGLFKKNVDVGHAYMGHGINHVQSILPCTQIIDNLVSLLEPPSSSNDRSVVALTVDNLV